MLAARGSALIRRRVMKFSRTNCSPRQYATVEGARRYSFLFTFALREASARLGPSSSAASVSWTCLLRFSSALCGMAEINRHVHTPKNAFEAGLAAKKRELRMHRDIRQPSGTFLVGLLEPRNRLSLFAHSGVQHRPIVRRHILR